MNRTSLLTFAVLFLATAWSTPADAKKKKRPIRKADNIGLGLGVTGNATGVSGKYYLGNNLSAQAVVGTWGLTGEAPDGLKLAANADVLAELPVVAKFDAFKVAPILGASGWLRMATELTEMGAGAVAGVSLLSKQQPITLSLEYRPTYGIINIPKKQALDLVGFGVQVQYVFPASRLR